MINILSYIGVSLQSELCLWTLLGLIRTIFDATLFKVNANLKQVWMMSMPPQLSMPLQQVTRTIISGVMLVQCFTVYVYLASYIVLLYPVFLEERPTLVLPWLLLAATRSFLCELTSLALGLGACLLLGAARPPCIKFVVFKVASIMPAFYMWILVFCYYNMLKVASAYKLPPTLTMMPSDHNYGLELAVRRRRTKSLQDEEQLRKKLVASLNYGETSQSSMKLHKAEVTVRMAHSTHADFDGIQEDVNEPFILTPLPPPEPKNSDLGTDEDWLGSEIVVPRDSDRILEQFSIMMLRIAAWMGEEAIDPKKMFSSHSNEQQVKQNNYESSSIIQGTDGDASPPAGNTDKTTSYLHIYPQIFKKKSIERQNTLTLNDSQPTKVNNAEINNKTINVTMNEQTAVENKNSGTISLSETVTKGIIETTSETKNNINLQKTESQQTTSLAIGPNCQKHLSKIKSNETSPQLVCDTELRPNIQSTPGSSQEPQRKDSGSQKLQNKDESEKLIAKNKVASDELTSHPSSQQIIQNQKTDLETIKERIKVNAARLLEQQRQQKNKGTENPEKHLESKK